MMQHYGTVSPAELTRLLDLYRNHGAMTQDEFLTLTVAVVQVLVDDTQPLLKQESAKALLLHIIHESRNVRL